MFLPEQYRALHEGAGLVDRTDRGQLSFTGVDRRAFLQGLLTNDILALEPGGGCYAALLTANGRMIADMRVFALGDRILLDVDAGLAAALRDRFDQAIFSEDAHVQEISADWRELGLYGPEAGRAIAAALPETAAGDSLESMSLYGNRSVDTPRGPVVVVRSDDFGIDGFDLLLSAAQAESIASDLRAAGARDVDVTTAEVTRIEAGRPKFGIDMDQDTIPLEAGIEDRAISLTKGCYVGQEIIIRVLHRGHGRVAKRLTGLTLDPSNVVPARGDVVRTSGRDIGVVTSATESPALRRPIAMAYVHRDFAVPATSVVVESDGREHPATVTSLPFLTPRS
jgi:folate-binding protein YgfZ